MRAFIDRYFIKKPRVREVMTRLIYGDADTTIRLCGLDLDVNRLRENGYFRAATKTRGSSLLENEIHVAAILSMLIPRADTFLDAGANVGFFSCMMAQYRKVQPKFRVIAFEPHPDTFARLARNGGRYGFESVNIALSKSNGRLDFVDGAVSHVFTSLDHACAYNILSRVISVECRRLDESVRDVGRCFLKIDTEGHELDVLQGAERLFANGQIVGVYVDGHDQTHVPATLRKWGFELLDAETLEPTTGRTFRLLALSRS